MSSAISAQTRVNLHTARELIERALRRGSDACEIVIRASTEFSVQVRLGQVETLKDSSSRGLGLRVFSQGRQASIATSDLEEDALLKLVDEAVEMAASTSVDETAGLPDPAEQASCVPDLDLFDPIIPQLSHVMKIELALGAEQAALDFDARIVNSDGGVFDSYYGVNILANSHGFGGEYSFSSCSLSVAPVASEAGKMQRDYWFDEQRKFSRLEDAVSLGRKAAERTIRKLGARKVKTQEVPIVFDPLTAAQLLKSVFNAVSGDAIFRKQSFLHGRLGERIAADILTIIDDGTLSTALGSKPFDDEGVPAHKTFVIERGVLRSYLLNSYTARKLGMRTTGNAARGLSGPPHIGAHNLYIEPGSASSDEIIASVACGLYVTDLIGFGVNPVNGDFSQGAGGIWIEDGKLAYPVEEVTIASNLREMLLGIEMIGDDPEWRSRTVSPTLKIAKMTVSGQ